MLLAAPDDHPDLFQTIILAIIQGISELFPISSVAHAVLTPAAFGWEFTPQFLKENFLPFVVMLHLGTAIALLLFFRRDWVSFSGALVSGRDPLARREFLLVIVGTIPAALLGLVFEKSLRGLFSSVVSAGLFLMLNGVLLYVGERAQERGSKTLSQLSFRSALLIGLAQSLALIPGFSRSGASIIAGFWSGLTHESAARFSMLLATPIIVGASVLELPKLARQANGEIFFLSAIGGLVAGLVAYGAVWALMTWFKRQEINAMRPFALYCWLVGASAILLSLS